MKRITLKNVKYAAFASEEDKQADREYKHWQDQMWNQPETSHKPICAEYFDRGLNCPCIPAEENKRIQAALDRGESPNEVIDAGWGQFD